MLCWINDLEWLLIWIFCIGSLNLIGWRTFVILIWLELFGSDSDILKIYNFNSKGSYLIMYVFLSYYFQIKFSLCRLIIIT